MTSSVGQEALGLVPGPLPSGPGRGRAGPNEAAGPVARAALCLATACPSSALAQ